MAQNKDLIFDIYEKVTGRSDLDWCEIAAKHNPNMSAETLRKAGVGIRMAAEAGMMAIPGVVNEGAMDEEYIAYRKEKQKFFDARREYNKLLIADARAEEIAEGLIRAADQLNERKPFLLEMLPQYNTDNREAVLVLTDWHVGMVTHNIWNDYDMEVFVRRVSDVVESVQRKLKLFRPNVLHVLVLGDMINGSIHTSCRVASELNACDQIMTACEVLAEVICELAADVPSVKVHCTYGNHARSVANIQDAIHSDNYERIIPFWLKERLKYMENVEIENEVFHEFVHVELFGKHMAATHGDLDTADTTLKISQIFMKQFGHGLDYLVKGHYHEAKKNDNTGVKVIGVSSLCGTDEYATKKRLFATPGQTLMTFNPIDGLESVSDIEVE